MRIALAEQLVLGRRETSARRQNVARPGHADFLTISRTASDASALRRFSQSRQRRRVTGGAKRLGLAPRAIVLWHSRQMMVMPLPAFAPGRAGIGDVRRAAAR